MSIEEEEELEDVFENEIRMCSEKMKISIVS
jgi:hypothetical protein